jgi:GATA-binding protein
MKSDVIRKRSRHDARRSGTNDPNAEDTPSASRGPTPEASPEMERSPTLAPDSTTQITYEFSEDSDFRASQSELMGALGNSGQGNFNGIFNPFPGPYHPDYLSQQSTATPVDALPFASVDNIEGETEPETKEESRSNKRRRMSTDSADEPPSSAVSYNSYNEGYSSQSSATSQSQRSSMDFPFNQYPSYNILRGSANTFWHPPMVAQDSPRLIHPPMLPSDSHMEYFHPPMLPQEEENLFNQYLHPPMLPADESSKSLMNSLHSAYGGNGPQSEYYDATMSRF